MSGQAVTRSKTRRCNWVCAQIGAREHYAIPRALNQTSRLAKLYTDFWANRPLREVSKQISSLAGLRSLANRYHAGVCNTHVRSWNLRALSWEAAHRVSQSSKYDHYMRVGREFATLVRAELNSSSGWERPAVLFTYDTGGLEALEWCLDRGVPSIVNQIDPNRAEVDLVQVEEALWPGWQPASNGVPEEYFKRREQEWALANRVVVNSQFCRTALIEQGVPPAKLVVIPLSYEKSEPLSGVPRASQRAAGPLRVLWLGQVIIRKGIQYLIEATRQLGSDFHFDIVGPIGISQEAIASAPPTVHFHGRATRSEIGRWFDSADVFVLPTISDGFAITQIEAMAYGLPVVTTPCCGDVVTSGVDGFIVPPRDSLALAKVLNRYAEDSALLQEHSAAALIKSRQFSLAHLAKRLLELEAQLLPA